MKFMKLFNNLQLIFNKTKQKGFTLVEMLIYMGLLSIFLITLTDIFVSILDVKAESEATSAVEADSRYIISRLAYDISKASVVSQPASLGATSNSLVMVAGGVTYTYSLNGHNLQLVNDSGANNLNSSESNLSNITFQRIGNNGGKDTIQVIFTINGATQRVAGEETRTFQTTLGRR